MFDIVHQMDPLDAGVKNQTLSCACSSVNTRVLVSVRGAHIVTIVIAQHCKRGERMRIRGHDYRSTPYRASHIKSKKYSRCDWVFYAVLKWRKINEDEFLIFQRGLEQIGMYFLCDALKATFSFFSAIRLARRASHSAFCSLWWSSLRQLRARK